MGNLIKKVDILEQTIENCTQKDFKNGETKDMPNIGASEKSDDEGDWNCVKCSFQTNGEGRLSKHIRVAHENGCDICENKYDSRKDLMDHKKEDHSETTKHCRDYLFDKCQYRKEECQYLHAEKEKNNVDVFKCNNCENTYSNFEELMEHQKKHAIGQETDDKDTMQVDQVDQYECPQCGNNFSSSEVFNEHKSLHENIHQHKCAQCDNSFSTEELLKEHVKVHHEYKCTKCSECFENRNDLRDHTKLHLKYIPCKNITACQYQERCFYSHEERGENEYPCFECGEKFEGVKNLMNHRKTVHGGQVCKKFLENKCVYSDQGCWFKHSSVKQKEMVFQKGTVHLKPPIQSNKDQNQHLIKSMLETMEQMKMFMMTVR